MKKLTLEETDNIKLSDSDGEYKKRFDRLNRLVKNRHIAETNEEVLKFEKQQLVVEKVKDQIKLQKMRADSRK